MPSSVIHVEKSFLTVPYTTFSITTTWFSNIAEDNFATTDLSTEAAGLLFRIKRDIFFETGTFLVQVLGVLKPANAILQSQTVDMCKAGDVVSAS